MSRVRKAVAEADASVPEEVSDDEGNSEAGRLSTGSMAPSNALLLAGVLLALVGAGSLLVDAGRADGSNRFVGYLVGLLLLLAGIGLLLATTV